MPTPHINAKDGDIAKTVIMSGDPLRAKFIAEKYLTDYKLVNDVRCMYAYTGYYKGKEVTVMGHGMGMPGAGIYFYELYKIYNVDTIIRIGSCGTFYKDIKALDTIIVDSSYTESNYAYMFSKENINFEKANKDVTKKLCKVALSKNISTLKGTILTSDVFDEYVDWKAIINRVPPNIEVLGVEMEAFALFHIARKLDKKAGCIATVVDSKYDNTIVTSDERQNSLTNMIEIALESL